MAKMSAAANLQQQLICYPGDLMVRKSDGAFLDLIRQSFICSIGLELVFHLFIFQLSLLRLKPDATSVGSHF